MSIPISREILTQLGFQRDSNVQHERYVQMWLQITMYIDVKPGNEDVPFDTFYLSFSQQKPDDQRYWQYRLTTVNDIFARCHQQGLFEGKKEVRNRLKSAFFGDDDE